MKLLKKEFIRDNRFTDITYSTMLEKLTIRVQNRSYYKKLSRDQVIIIKDENVILVINKMFFCDLICVYIWNQVEFGNIFNNICFFSINITKVFLKIIIHINYDLFFTSKCQCNIFRSYILCYKSRKF